MAYIALAVTAVLAVLKLAGITKVATMSWWLVFAPALGAVAISFFVVIFLSVIAYRSITKR